MAKVSPAMTTALPSLGRQKTARRRHRCSPRAADGQKGATGQWAVTTASALSGLIAREPNGECSLGVLPQLHPLIRARSAEHDRNSYGCDRE